MTEERVLRAQVIIDIYNDTTDVEITNRVDLGMTTREIGLNVREVAKSLDALYREEEKAKRKPKKPKNPKAVREDDE